MIKDTDSWKIIEANINMQHLIFSDKLKQGINGVEWLVLQTKVDKDKRESLNAWLKFINRFNKSELLAIMKDAILLDSVVFHERHEINWWISIEETISYLSLLRERDYDSYFKFLKEVERDSLKGGEEND